jgi:hypothetical protein
MSVLHNYETTIRKLSVMDKSLYCGLCGDAAAHGPCERLAAAHTHMVLVKDWLLG